MYTQNIHPLLGTTQVHYLQDALNPYKIPTYLQLLSNQIAVRSIHPQTLSTAHPTAGLHTPVLLSSN